MQHARFTGESPKQCEARSREQLLDLAYRNNISNIAVNVIAGTGMYLLLLNYRSLFIDGWLVALCLLAAVRIVSTFAYRRRSRQGVPDYRTWYYLYGGGLMGACLLWAAMMLFTVPNVDAPTRYSLAIIVSAIAGGATGTLAPLFRFGSIYIGTILIGGGIALMLCDPPEILMAGLAGVFLGAMLVTLRNNHHVLKRSFLLQTENTALVEDMRQKNAQLADVNSWLERRVEDRTRELRELANHDPLTGVMNRAGFLKWFAAEEERGYASAGLLFIDLDHFKLINDTFNHEAGDHVLAQIGRRLSVIASTDEAIGVARWGGDEFLVALFSRAPEAHEQALQLGETVQTALRAPLRVLDRDVTVHCSIGVATARAGSSILEDLVRTADLASAAVKKNGRNSLIVFGSEVAASVEREAAITAALKPALDKGDFRLAFQPVVRAGDRGVHAYEALLRWQDPVLGVIPPDEFIALAEKTGLIHELGDWVLREACRLAVAEGPRLSDTKIAVNISPRQLADTDFPQRLEAILAETGYPAGRLILEVTESIFEGARPRVVLPGMRHLSELGVEFHIDDFGTGYSSLSRLHNMPIHALKIDRSFVQRLDPHALAIIEGAILIARRFNIAVVIEGIEEPGQADLLERLGPDYLQGYLFGRPSAGFAG